MKLEVSNLAFSYAGAKRGDATTEVLSDINFTLHDGDILTILGPNGAGKTTLVKCLLGIAGPYSGQIWIDGKDVGSLSIRERARLMGYSSVSSQDTVTLDVLDYVCLAFASRMQALSVPRSEQYGQAAEMCQNLGIGSLLHRSMDTLSQGERHLASFARVLTQDPRIVIFDEPTASLDIRNQREFLQILKRLSIDGRIVIQISHDPNHALILGGMALLLSASGSQFGAVREVVSELALSQLYDTDLHILSSRGAQAVAFTL